MKNYVVQVLLKLATRTRHQPEVCGTKYHIELSATRNKVPHKSGSHLLNLLEPPP